MHKTYFVFYLLIIIISTYFFRKAAGSLSIRKINIVSMLYYRFMIIHIIGFGIGLLGIRSYKIIILGLSLSEHEMGILSLLVAIHFLILSFTLYILNIMFPIKLERIEVRYSKKNNAAVLGTWILLVFVILGILFLGLENHGFPIFKLFSGASTLEIGIARHDFVSRIPYIQNLLVATGAPIAAGMSFVLINKYRIPKERYLLFLISWAIFIFACTMKTEKSAVIGIIAFYFVLNIYVGKKIKIRKMLYWATLVLILLLLLNVRLEHVMNLKYSIYNIISRIFLDQNNGFYCIFDLLKNQGNYLGLSGVSSLVAKVFGIEFIESHRLAMATFSHGAVARGTGGEMSTLYIAEAYMVGGPICAIISTVWVGILTYFFHYMFQQKLPKSAFFISIYAYLTVFWVGKISSGFFTNFVVNWTFIFLISLIICGLLPYYAVKNKACYVPMK